MMSRRFQILALAYTVLWSSTQIATTDGDPVCYGYLGCFPMGPPWFDTLRPVPAPQSPESVDTQFYLYTRARPQLFTVTKLPEISLQGSDYDGRKPTFFISHGYQGSSNGSLWLNIMKDALINRVDSNVFLVNWQKGAEQINYLQVASNSRIVAAEIARLIEVLLKSHNASVSRIHLIGHSIGAHVMAYVANRIQNISRITALDPAQPGFEGYDPQVRIDQNDANFVEVIHSNCRPFIPFFGFGMMAAVGHVDFYLNGGWNQPGCIQPPNPSPLKVASLQDLVNVTLEEISYIVLCPHQRACYFFIAAIKNRNHIFWGQRVNPFAVALSIMTSGDIAQFYKMDECTRYSCSAVGLETINYPARGSFYVATTATDPFFKPTAVDRTTEKQSTSTHRPKKRRSPVHSRRN